MLVISTQQQDSMLRSLHAKEILVNARRDSTDLQTPFGDEADTDVLWFIGNTEVGTKPAEETNNNDFWDIEWLDRAMEEVEVMHEDGGEEGVD